MLHCVHYYAVTVQETIYNEMYNPYHKVNTLASDC